MKVKEITAILEEIHGVSLMEDTVDGIKYGDENAVVTGIMVSCCASIEVLQKAVEEGCNLIIVHEPVFIHTRISIHGRIPGLLTSRSLRY